MAPLQNVIALLAIVATAAGIANAEEPRPTMDEWKEKKGEEADEKAAAAAKQSKMAAVEKVVSLLEDLQTTVMAEGEKEAASYNKFACFCKDTTKEKTDSIQKGEDQTTTLSASITELQSKRDGLDTMITDIEEVIKDTEEEMAEAMKEHDKSLKEYAKNEADLSGALSALKDAIKVMKASKNPTLVQMQQIANTVRSAALMADALGLGGVSTQRTAAQFLQQAPEVPFEEYKFHSGGIIETLETLLKKFTDEKTEVDAEEVKRVAAHDSFMQEKTDLVKQKNKELDDTRKERAKTIEEIASDSEQLTTVAAQLLDDKEYLAELVQMCSDKAKTWDQRIQVRQDELSALTSAVAIVKDAVSEKTAAATIRFAQRGVSVRLAEAVAKNAPSMEAMEADAEANEAPTFLQRVQRAEFNDSPELDVARREIVTLFRTKGKELRSTLLTGLASQVAGQNAEDKFAKIKTLIQELIERLLSEAANEANQKGWCDKAMVDAEQKRDNAADEVQELNGEMARLEALRDKLTEELEVLAAEIKELHAKRDEAVKMRADEKAENEATVQEAKDGKEAVESAIDILDKFYKTAAKGEVDLSLAQGPADDAPDAGFKIGEAYTGSQGAAGGVLGMLDVIKSDFVRTITETEKAEKQAEQDHLEFMTETGKSLAEKETAETEKTRQNDDAKDKLSSASDSLTSNSDILRSSIKELLELKPTCIDTGMSYEERVSRRKDEMEALKKALCILEAYQQYGADGISGQC